MPVFEGVLFSSPFGGQKLGRVNATYTYPQSTCPSTCPLKGKVCFASFGRVGMKLSQLREQHGVKSAISLAYSEAHVIRFMLDKQLPTRIHVSGDCKTAFYASILAGAVNDAVDAGAAPFWTYSHTWRTIRANAWGRISTMASIERASDGLTACRAGYAPALVVAENEQRRFFTADGVKYTTCPHYFNPAITCDRCRICWQSERLAERCHGVALPVHGAGRKRLPLVAQ